jgi:hypothetical protein
LGGGKRLGLVTQEALALVALKNRNRMKRQTPVRQLFLNNAPLLVALLGILVPGRLVALGLDPVRVGGYDTTGEAYDVVIKP